MQKNNYFSFSKKKRLLNSNAFNNVFQYSMKFETLEIVILNLLNNFHYPRLGLIVSKRVSKYSYQRNKIKRLIRESFRLIQYNLHSYDFIMIAKPSILRLDNKKIRIILNRIWYRYYQ